MKKIDKIYSVIADKTLSFWCKVELTHFKRVVWESDFVISWYSFEKMSWKCDAIMWWNHIVNLIQDIYEYERCWSYAEKWDMYYQIKKNIWHPVMIWDVLDWMKVNNIEEREHEKLVKRKWEWTHFTYVSTTGYIMHYRNKLRKPIEDQPDECIDFIYNLLTK